MKNKPSLWIENFPSPQTNAHKYNRGQVAVLGGVDMTGAACLSADAAARIGAGIVTIISPYLTIFQKMKMLDPLLAYKVFKPYLIARNDISMNDFVKNATLKGCVCSVVGPGLGGKEYAVVRAIILSVLDQGVPIVLDADGLNAFEGHQDSLWAHTHENAVLTPHDGEFKKLFPDVLKEDRTAAAIEAAKISNSIVVLKGTNSIIAAPDGEFVINDNALAYLATAGSGDVLSGIIAGLLSQGMSPFKAACAAVWMHGRASEIIGCGLVASDVIEIIPKILKETLGIREKLG